MKLNLHALASIAGKIIKIWKPDFRKTTGWFFITTGVVLISPPFLTQLVLALTGIAIPELLNAGDDRLLGIYLIALGVHYHLWYGASQDNRKTDARVISWLIWVATSSLIAVAMARLI